MLAHYLGKYACISKGNRLVLRVYPFTSLITCMSTFKNSVDPGRLASKEARLIWIHTDFFLQLHPMSPIQANLHTLNGSRSTVAHDQLVTALDCYRLEPS